MSPALGGLVARPSTDPVTDPTPVYIIAPVAPPVSVFGGGGGAVADSPSSTPVATHVSVFGGGGGVVADSSVPSALPSGEELSTTVAPPPGSTAVDPAGTCPVPTTQRTLAWDGMPSGVGVVIGGGAYSLDTMALDDFAATLESAACWLDDAHDLVVRALADIQDDPTPSDDAAAGWSVDGSTVRAPFTSPAFPGLYDPGAARAQAEEALAAASEGTGSLQDAADALRTLAADVEACVDLYSGAEQAATDVWTVPYLVTDASASAQTTLWLLSAGSGWAGSVLTAVDLLTGHGILLPEEMDSSVELAQTAMALINDPALSQWGRGELLALLFIAVRAKDADTGTERDEVEAYLQGVAPELAAEVRDALPDTSMVGSQVVPTDSLTPMQQVAAYLAMVTSSAAAQTHGARTGVSVTPAGGQTVTVPTGSSDPFGLSTPVAPAGGTWEPTTAPASAADLVRRSDAVSHGDVEEGHGTVSILRTTHEDGTTSWVVLVPGTRVWSAGTSDPQDLLTNFEALSGAPTDMSSAVVTAMREAGVGSEDEVAIYGHSQGAMTAAGIAADPAVNEQFTVTTLLTAGGPTAGADLPSSVNALHLENTGDAVPALDAAPTPTSPTRTVVTLDTHAAQLQSGGYPHGGSVYAEALDGMEGDPAVDAWTAQLQALTGANEEGAVTEQMVFDIQRETEVTGWEQAEEAVDNWYGEP